MTQKDATLRTLYLFLKISSKKYISHPKLSNEKCSNRGICQERNPEF